VPARREQPVGRTAPHRRPREVRSSAPVLCAPAAAVGPQIIMQPVGRGRCVVKGAPGWSISRGKGAHKDCVQVGAWTFLQQRVWGNGGRGA
jgi:hypothetical protein